MTKDEWSLAATMLDEFFAGDFREGKEDLYYEMLKDYDVDVVIAAVKRLAAGESKFTPTMPEMMHAIRDVTGGVVPEFTTAMRGIERELRWRPKRSELDKMELPLRYSRQQLEPHTLKRISQRIHPIAAAWAYTYGLDRMRMEPVDHPDEGKWVTKRRRESYEAFCLGRRAEDATRAAIGTGGSLHRLDPADALKSLPRPSEDF